MYIEDENSKNLMRLNAYYRDKRYRNKRLMSLFNAREEFKKFIMLFKDILKIRQNGWKKTKLKVRAFFNRKIIEDYNLEYDFNHSYELEYKSKGKKINGKVAVYTSIFGNYDSLIEPLYKSENCDYFAITDQNIPQDSVWKKYDISKVAGFDKMDDYHKSKFCKMFPHVLFPEYEYSIWVDGNVQIVADLLPLVDRTTDSCMATFKNPLHDCIYTEANYVICQNNVKVKQVLDQINAYKEMGFPKKFGMREFSIIVREHNNPECKKLMNDWWEQVNTYTMRDQLSFPYVLWKNGKNIDFVQLLGENWRWNPRFIWFSHNWHIYFSK